METDGQEGLKNKREQQHLLEGLENPLRKRHKGQPSSGGGGVGTQSPPKAGLGHRRNYTGRGGRPRLHENLESGAQDEPTGEGTEKTRAEERQYRRVRRWDAVEQPRGRREARYRARIEDSGNPTPKPRGSAPWTPLLLTHPNLTY